MIPRPLRLLLAKFLADVAKLTTGLENGAATVESWQRQMEQALARYHAAALMAGQGSATLADPARTAIAETVKAQLQFLDNFALEVQGAAEWRRGWHARAALYAQGIKQSYWRGATKMLPLPAMPGDGTTPCMGNCKCAWEVTQLAGENNYDCRWVLSDAEHCQGCVARSRRWAPLKIREGRIV